ncbi:protein DETOXIFICATION 45, chloroplastic-like, partial [Phalaenopsis equestris]|uniref:protein DETOXIFICATION 45, chloroplastic-like n=1 Tax=Phalaenopsis equestris TaxID=78828 RepID=UPI0009E357FD
GRNWRGQQGWRAAGRDGQGQGGAGRAAGRWLTRKTTSGKSPEGRSRVDSSGRGAAVAIQEQEDYLPILLALASLELLLLLLLLSGFLLGRTLSVLISMTLGTSMAARLGPLAMAAHQICLQIWLAVSLISDALALSAQALIASSFAKHDYKRVKEITLCVLKIGLLMGITLALILFVSFDNVAELFTKDVELLTIVRSGVVFVSASQPINALAFIFDGLHYGVSDFAYSAYSMIALPFAALVSIVTLRPLAFSFRFLERILQAP